MHLTLLHIMFAITMNGIEFLFISRDSINKFISITCNLRFCFPCMVPLPWIQRLETIEKTFNSFLFNSHTGARMNHQRKQFVIYYNTFLSLISIFHKKVNKVRLSITRTAYSSNIKKKLRMRLRSIVQHIFVQQPKALA